MRWHHCALILASLFSFTSLAHAGDRVFEGPWKTTNRKLDGIMTAVVKDLGNDKWQGRFYGVWQGVPFDYTVKFNGKPDSLKGTAVIDFADYTWTGSMQEPTDDKEPAVFKGSFGGSRYAGYFALKETKNPNRPPVVAAKPVTTIER